MKLTLQNNVGHNQFLYVRIKNSLVDITPLLSLIESQTFVKHIIWNFVEIIEYGVHIYLYKNSQRALLI